MHIWAEIPAGERIRPNPGSDQSVKPSSAPATEGIPLRNICFFVLVRKWGWEKKREERSVCVGDGGGCRNWITMVTSITFLFPSLWLTHNFMHMGRKWVSKKNCWFCFYLFTWRQQSNRDITDLIRAWWQFYCSSYYGICKAKMLIASQLFFFFCCKQ